MADALASGASVRKDVGVQVPPRAPASLKNQTMVCQGMIIGDSYCLLQSRTRKAMARPTPRLSKRVRLVE
jgi:hypothetical protein